MQPLLNAWAWAKLILKLVLSTIVLGLANSILFFAWIIALIITAPFKLFTRGSRINGLFHIPEVIVLFITLILNLGVALYVFLSDDAWVGIKRLKHWAHDMTVSIRRRFTSYASVGGYLREKPITELKFRSEHRAVKDLVFFVDGRRCSPEDLPS